MEEPTPVDLKRRMRSERERKPHFVYEFYDRTGQALYVGCTVDIPTRLRAHMTKHWWAFVHDVRFVRYQDRLSGMTAELERIRDLQPLYNVQATDWGNEQVRERHRRSV